MEVDFILSDLPPLYNYGSVSTYHRRLGMKREKTKKK